MRLVAVGLLALLMIPCAACVLSVEPSKPTDRAEAPAQAQSAVDQRFCRNMVNLVDKNIPTEWSIQEGAQKNIKWAAKIGISNTGYMPPTIGAGKVFIASNNTDPRDPKIKGDKAILKCFRESDGQFLWQIVH